MLFRSGTHSLQQQGGDPSRRSDHQPVGAQQGPQPTANGQDPLGPEVDFFQDAAASAGQNGAQPASQPKSSPGSFTAPAPASQQQQQRQQQQAAKRTTSLDAIKQVQDQLSRQSHSFPGSYG